MLTFALHAALSGSFFARIAELQLRLGLDDFHFSLALVGTPLGVILSLFVVPPLLTRFGPSRVMAFASVMLAAVSLAGAYVTDFAGFALVLTSIGLGISMLNTAMNIQADRIALASGRPMIAKCHASWGFGFMLTSGLAALAIRVGLMPRLQFALMLAVTLAFAIFVLRRMPDLPERTHASTVTGWRNLLPDAAILAIVGFGICSAMVEGVARNWATIYLRDTYDAPTWVAALALPILMGMQTLGRIGADGAVQHLGEARLGRICAVVTLLGTLLTAFAPTLPLAVAGFGLLGLGISTASILMVNAVLSTATRPPAQALSIIGSVMNVAAFVSPPLYGFIASGVGLRFALLSLVPMAILSYVHCRALGPVSMSPARPQAS
jgi:Na+/melibiose symporter-like transporter